MDIRQLRVFLAVAESGSVTLAAERLGRTQPAVSTALKALETELGQTLFLRRRGRLALSAAGLRLRPHAESVLQAVSAAELSLRDAGRRQIIRLGVLTTLASSRLAPLLQRLAAAHPDRLLRLREETPERLSRLLRQGRLDLTLTVLDGAADRHSHLLRVEPYLAMMAPGHALARRRRLTLADLAGQPFILRQHCENAEAAGRRLRAAGVGVQVVAQVGHDDLALELVAAGQGLTVAPASLHRAPLLARPIRDFDLTRRLGLRWRSETDPALVQAAIAAFGSIAVTER